MKSELLPRPPLMAITQDGHAWNHEEQVHELLKAGVAWIQLRMKSATSAERLEVARRAAEACRRHHAVFIVNDDVEAALGSGAHGVHLGAKDLSWALARGRLGPDLILGGTVNNAEQADLARSSGVLDYVGLGPWKFTTTKKELAPVLGAGGIRPLVETLRPLPVWVIGGIQEADMPLVRDVGAAGAAVSSALFHGGSVTDNVQRFNQAWLGHAETLSR